VPGLAPALIERFRRDLEAAQSCTTLPGDRFALAVSGGPDSMAMLALASAALPGSVFAATVDHGLREASAAEAAMVADYCALMGVPHQVLTPSRPIAGASIQAQARGVRYQLLARWSATLGARALLTAHHADDQAETFLMRAARGSGISGLAAIRERREALAGAADPLPVVRPLLAWRRAELRAVAEAAGAPFVDDPSNADDAFDRTRFRRLFEANPWLDVPGIAQAAMLAAEADRALRICADMLWDDVAQVDEGGVLLDPADLPGEIRHRLVSDAIDHVRRTHDLRGEWRGGGLDRLLATLDSGGTGTIAGVQARDVRGRWHFRLAPPRRSH
jgi:tRNA(Ile)-lysidine synthase